MLVKSRSDSMTSLMLSAANYDCNKRKGTWSSQYMPFVFHLSLSTLNMIFRKIKTVHKIDSDLLSVPRSPIRLGH